MTSKTEQSSSVAGHSPVSLPGAAIRLLGTTPWLAVAIGGVLAVALLLLTLSGPLFESASERALSADLASASATDRNLEISRDAQYELGSRQDPFSPVGESMAEFRNSRLPALVASLVIAESFVVDSPQFATLPYPGTEPKNWIHRSSRIFERLTAFVTLRHQSSIDEMSSLVAGRQPAPAAPVPLREGADCPPVMIGEDPVAPDTTVLSDLDGDGTVTCVDVPVPRFEVVASVGTLESFDMEIGDRMILLPDVSDQLLNNAPRVNLPRRLVIEVVGVIEATDPNDDYWLGDKSLETPRVRINPDFTDRFATFLVAPEVHEDLRQHLDPALWAYSFRYLLAHDEIGASNAAELSSELSNMETQYRALASTGSLQLTMRSGLPELIRNYELRRHQTLSLIVIVLAGVLIASFAVVLLLGSLTAERSRFSVGFLRRRGASKPQIGTMRATQGVAIAVVAVLVAGVVGSLIASSWRWVPIGLALTVVVVAGLMMAIAGGASSYGPLIESRAQISGVGGSARRLIAELLLIALSVLAVVILRRRGDVVSDGGLDALAVLAPWLLAISGGLILSRLYPMLVKPFVWIGSRLRGPLVFGGFQRVLQNRRRLRLPMVVLVLGAAVAMFGYVVQHSLTEGAAASVRQLVGADHRLTAFEPGMPLPAIDLDDVESIQAVAEARLFIETVVASETGAVPRSVNLFAIDGAAFESVIDDMPGQMALPEWLASPEAGSSLGGRSNPIHVIVSGSWPTGTPAVGTTFSADVEFQQIHFIVSDVRADFPGVSGTDPTVVASLPQVSSTLGLDVREGDIFVRGNASAADELRSLAQEAGNTRLLSAGELLEERLGDSFARTAAAAPRGAVVVAASIVLVAATAAIFHLSTESGNDNLVLGTLGMSARQRYQLAAIEHIPMVVFSLVAGVGLGAGIALVLDPVIVLGPFGGDQTVVAIDLSITNVLLVGSLVIGMAGATSYLATPRSARRLSGPNSR